MKQESLEVVANKCYMAILNSDINDIDKLELLRNVNKFLGKDYEENIKILNDHEKMKRR